jgi:hypothetical protein
MREFYSRRPAAATLSMPAAISTRLGRRPSVTENTINDVY